MGAFLGGVLASEVVNNAMHLAQPLLIARLSGSLGEAAFFSAFDTAVHMGGTALGGWPADKLGARRLLIVSTLLRGAALALIPLLWLSGRLTVGLAMAAYTLDAAVRGFVDTAVHTLPLELAAHERAELDRLNSRYELVFAVGAIAGPLLLGAMMLWMKGVAVHALIPLGFALSALIFVRIPERRGDRADARESAASARRQKTADAPERGGTREGLRLVLARPELLYSCLGLAVLNLYPLRKLMSAFFAKSILKVPAAAGWVGAAFGLGGALGALLYALRSRRAGFASGAGWVAAGAAGTLALALGWLPGSLSVMLAAVFAFALTNVGARLATTARLQLDTPAPTAGGVTAVARFGQNAVSVGLKALLGAAFA
ncbi:MAG: MFS transporter, partial [Elusimicrobia bacterium]|nr:MFS transporter [Elusimicrobiota bacterium]